MGAWEGGTYTVLTQTLVKLLSYMIQLQISNIMYAALARLQVSGKPVSLPFL
jgi:hypothetical protein